MSAQNIKKQVLTETERQTKLHKRLSAQIFFHRKDKIEESLKLKPNVNFCPDNETPYLITAISSCNDWAFDKLLELGADVTQAGSDGLAPLLLASALGNIRAVNALLNILHDKKIDPNKFFAHDNALGRAVVNIRRQALIDNSSWNTQDPVKHGNDIKLSNLLKDWFYQRGDFAEKVVGTAISFPKTIKNIQTYYTGNTEIIALLLNAGVKLWMPDSNGLSPLMIVQEPEKCPKYFNDEDTKLQKIENGLIYFNFKLENRNHTDSIEISGVYDLQIIRKQFLEFMKANPNKAYNAADLKSLAQAIEYKVKDELNEKHERLAKQVNDTRAVHEEIKENHEQLRLESKQNADFLNNLIQKDNEGQNWKARQDLIDKNSITKAFRTAFNTRLRGAIGGSVDIAGTNVQRNEKTVKDKASKLLSFIAGYIPVFGAAVGALATGLHYYTEWSEEKKHKQVARFFDNTAEQEDLSQKLAIELTEYCQFLNDKTIIKNDKVASELGEKLAAAAYLVILTVEDKSRVRGLMFDAVIKSGIMNKEIHEYFKHLQTSAKSETSNLLTAISSIQVTSSQNKPATIYYFTDYLQTPVYQQSLQSLDLRAASVMSSYPNGYPNYSPQAGQPNQLYAYQQQPVNVPNFPLLAPIVNSQSIFSNNKKEEGKKGLFSFLK